MKRITHITTGLNMGGAERALHTLLTGGLEGPYQNHVISLTDEGHYGRRLMEAGIPVSCLNMVPSRLALRDILRLRAVLSASRPDILQGWMYHGNVAATVGRYLMWRKPPTVWNVRTTLEAPEVFSSGTRRGVSLGKALSGTVHRIIYNSERGRDQHEHHGFASGSSIVIPNGFNTEIWRGGSEPRRVARAAMGVDDDAILLGFVGRNDPLKDPQNFYAALQTVLPRFPQLQVAVIGKDLIDALPPTLPAEQLRFFGPRADVQDLVPGFDVFCLSSMEEGFPNVIGEAMACAVPCVTTDVGDAARIIADTGWIVPARDSKALASAVIEALSVTSAERKSLGGLARKRIEDNYSLESVLDQYLALYRGLGGGGG